MKNHQLDFHRFRRLRDFANPHPTAGDVSLIEADAQDTTRRLEDLKTAGVFFSANF